ncbi:MAG TPA: tetratricopeptide repeat protein [Thermoanaerobaculia bacterium]|nr:tetratricopeptide repeat protein [Thermoanaerobaculia bacterium]
MKHRFGEFTLDLEASRLLGPEGEVRLRPQAFRMLEVLVESAPKILSQEELLDRVWGVEHLSPASVKQAVSEVRQALGDDPAKPRIIETVHRRGYRFIATLEKVEPPVPSESPEPPRKDELDTRPMAMSGILARVEPPPPAPPPPARRRLPVSLLVPLLAGLAVVVFLGRALSDRVAQPETAAEAAAKPARLASPRPAVAILGFRNLSAHPRDAWISSALGEILHFELTAPGRLRLIPAENVSRMRRELGLGEDGGSTASLAGIGRNLGTHLVVTGSYLVSRSEEGEKIRIQLMVQDVRTAETIAWARETGSREELLDLATAAARGILGSLLEGPGAAPPEAAALAANAESLRLWSDAVARLRVRDAMAALPLLQKAETMDPDNPFIHGSLAAAWSLLGFDARAGSAAARAQGLAKALPEEIRLGIEARAHEVRDEWKEASARYAELWRRYPDNLDYGLGLAAAQKQAGDTEAALATVGTLRQLPAPDGEDPRIDLAEADAVWQLGDFARTRDITGRAVETARQRGATLLVAEGRVVRGWAFRRLGSPDAALADFQAARALYEKTGDRGAAAGARAAEATMLQSLGRTAEARRAYEEVIAVHHEMGDRSREAKTLNNYAALVGGIGDLEAAVDLLGRSLAIKREIEDLQGSATTLVNLGNFLGSRGDVRGARQHLEEAIGISRHLGDAHGTALALRGISRIHAREGHFAAGRAALEEAIGLSRQSGDAEGHAQAELALAELEKKAGRLDESRRHYERALDAFRRNGDAAYVATLVLDLAEIDLQQGRIDAARAGYRKGLELARGVENPSLEAHARFGLAEIAARHGEIAVARPEYEKALALWTELKDQDRVAETRAAMARLGGRG